MFWKVSYGHRRVLGAGGGPAHIEVFEPEAEVVREIFCAYVERGLSVRQIAFWLRERGIASPTGKPIWGTSTIDRLLRNEAYIGTMYYNRYESLEGGGPRGVRNRKTRQRERPREEWIAISVPAIIEPELFERVKQVSHDNSQLSPRGAEPARGCYVVWSTVVTVMLAVTVSAFTDATPPFTVTIVVLTTTYCEPDQTTAAVQSATSALTSSTSTFLNRSAKRYLPLSSCSPLSAP